VLGDEERDRQHVKYKEQKSKKPVAGLFNKSLYISLAEALVGVTELLTIIVVNLVTLSLT
jgi:hypothetical protein